MGSPLGKKRRRIVLIIVSLLLLTFLFLGESENPKLTSVLEKISQLTGAINHSLEKGLGLEKETVKTRLESPILQAHFIDVGQGEAILLRTGEGDILIDGGETFSAQKVTDYLEALGIDRLELVIATHPHSDHIGGLAEVIRTTEVSRVAMPEIPDSLVPTSQCFSELLTAVKEKKLKISTLRAGDHYNYGQVMVDILAPISEGEDLNNLSAIIKVTAGEVSFLFTGDAESPSENWLLTGESGIRADVLNVAHHGSNTSTTAEFLEAVRPQIAVISCGVDNSYGHPHREVVGRLKDLGAEIYRTDLDGTIIVETDGRTLSVSTEAEGGEPDE